MSPIAVFKPLAITIAVGVAALGAILNPLASAAPRHSGMGTIAPAASSRNAAYSFASFQYPKDTFTQLLGINNGTRVAGYHGMNVNKGFKFRLPNNIQNWNFPKSAQTQVIGINNMGDTVGFYVDSKGTTHGFFQNHKTNKWMSVDVPSTTFNQLLGVNDHQTAAGYYQYGKNNIFQPYTHAANGAFTLIPIHNAQATDINNAGWVTGFQVVGASGARGFLIRGAHTQYLKYPGSSFTQALGVNNKGLVVGTYNDSKGNARGFTYTVSTGMYHEVNVPASSSTVVNGVNDGGSIVGFYTSGKNTIGFEGHPK